MLITSYQERKNRHNEKLFTLLSFLKEETYTDMKTIKEMYGFKSEIPLYRFLSKVENMGLIQKHTHETRGSKISLWGITSDGISVILSPEDTIVPARFEPSRLTGWSLDHHLDNQMTRLIMEKKGATGWINGDRSTFLAQYNVKHRPDGLISLPDGRLIAVETERRIKTKARYQSIMASHLLAISDKKWRYAFYVTPDEAKKHTLRLIFNSIKSVIVKGHHVTLEAKHRDVFRFYTIDELKNLELQNYA